MTMATIGRLTKNFDMNAPYVENTDSG